VSGEGQGATTCRVCHRALKNPHAVALGVGPVCARRKGIPLFDVEQNRFHRGQELGPFHGDVVCCYLDGQRATNIPHAWPFHTLEEFRWASSAAGASDLALNILVLFTTRERAGLLCQEFKQRFITAMPKEGGVIKGAEIRAWLEAQGKVSYQ
jgi:hypothetical protein